MDSPNSLGCCPSCPNGISDTLRPLPSEWTYPNVAGKPIPCFRDAVMLKSACPCLRRNQRQIAPVADLRILFLAARVYARVRIPPKALGRPMSSCFRLALNPVAWDGPRLGGMPIENETPEQRLERRRQQSNNAISWLDSHWTQPRTCPVCGGNQWSVAQTFDLREFEGGHHYRAWLGSSPCDPDLMQELWISVLHGRIGCWLSHSSKEHDGVG